MLWADKEVLKELCYAVHVDIRIPPTLQGTIPPVLDVNVGFLVQLADGGRRNLAAPQCLGDILHTAHGNACQIHLNERLLHAALPAAIPLDDGRLEGHALEPGDMERDVAVILLYIILLQMSGSIFAQYSFNTHAIRIIFAVRL